METNLESNKMEHVEMKMEETSQEEANESCPTRQPLFSHPFSCEGRIRRLEFCLSYFFSFIINIIVAGLMQTNYAYGILSAPVIIFMFTQTCKRFHDMNRSGFYMLTLLIPFINITPIAALLFLDGDSYENDYGEDPKGRNTL